MANAYAIMQDGFDTKIWIANTMADAIDNAYKAYIVENDEQDTPEERDYFERHLESCNLVGEVGEVPE